MLFGNPSNGFSFSPDRSRDVSHDNLRSQFLGASGSRATGFCSSPTFTNPKPSGGEWKRSGGGGWYQE